MTDGSQRVHFVGIGGVGMSALAEVLHARGYAVTGSDRQPSALTRCLEKRGIAVQYDHRPQLVRAAGTLVYSSAIRPQNAERQYARRHGIGEVRRAEMLGQLMRGAVSVGVAGTHGKTTTTALITHVLAAAGMRPTGLVGGVVRGRESCAQLGRQDLMVVEADEFDRSFLAMRPTHAVVTNIDGDHLECYRDIEGLTEAFVAFADGVGPSGTAFVCADDPRAAGAAARFSVPVVTYGLVAGANVRALEPALRPGCSCFEVCRAGRPSGRVELPLPGQHNVCNALAAVAVADRLGVRHEDVLAGLASFPGVKRRFEVVGTWQGATVVDDYAHHPRELLATLTAARVGEPSRVVAVFQPHLYSRTRDLCDEFAASLMRSDLAVVCQVYGSREDPIPGVTGEMIVEALRARGHRNAHYVEDAEDVPGLLVPLLRPGDTVVVMGAGDIGRTAYALSGLLKAGGR